MNYGILTTQYDEYKAEQSIFDARSLQKRKDILTETQTHIEDEFDIATNHAEGEHRGARTLFSSAIEAEQTNAKQKMQMKNVLQRDKSSDCNVTARRRGLRESELSGSIKGNSYIQNMLMASNANKEKLQNIRISELYLPSNKREFQSGLLKDKA